MITKKQRNLLPVLLCIKIYTPEKPLYGDLPVNSSNNCLSFVVDIRRSNSTPLTFNNSSNLVSVTDKFWFNNILFIINALADFSLLIKSSAKDSSLFAKGLIELKNIFVL